MTDPRYVFPTHSVQQSLFRPGPAAADGPLLFDAAPAAIAQPAAAQQIQLEVVEAQTDGYHSRQNPDGTWDIFNVPFFSAHVDERGAEPELYSVAWLIRAVQVAQARAESDGFLGPLHVQHHLPGQAPGEVTFAGKIRLTRVRALIYEGVPTPTIFGDLVQVPGEVYQELKSGQLPYRSVEIHGPSEPEILSLALLDHEVPYFRYAVMQIAREHAYKTPGKKPARKSLVCFRADGVNNLGIQTRSLTFHYPGGTMALGNTGANPLLNFNPLGTGPAPLAGAPAAAAPVTFNGVAELMAQAMQMLQGLMETMNAIAEQTNGMGNGEEENGAPPVMASMNTPVEVRAAESQPAAVGAITAQAPAAQAPAQPTKGAQGTPHAAEALVPAEQGGPLAVAMGRIAALESQAAAYQATTTEQQVQNEREVEAVAFAQSGAGNDDVDTFRSLWQKNGADSARAFAASMNRSFAGRPVPPPSGFNGDLPAQAGPAGGGLHPEEVMAYQAQGPEKFAEAQHWHLAWQRGRKQHPLKTYLAAQLDEASFFTAGAGRLF